MKIGYDHDLYTRTQSEHIRNRIESFGGKLYLELGGKLFDDNHASRVLPGFRPDSKISMLLTMKEQIELIIVINADDIEKNKVRGDLGITYDADVLRLIDAFRSVDMYVGSVVLSRYNGQPLAEAFQKRLESLGVRVYRHYPIKGYPADVDLIVSDEGYGRNEYVETTRPLVLVTAPGPGSGKMAVCLSQLYQDHKRGTKAGYAKFETFPIWNLPLTHPVNVAYEAATADLSDVNMIDPYHLEAYGVSAVNYNRDIEVFPVLQAIFARIWGESPYKSPTDMGVNMVGNCIIDNDVCCNAAKQEIIRRYYNAKCQERKGNGNENELNKLQYLMQRLKLSDHDRPVVEAARKRAEETDAPAAAIQLDDGRIITGKTSSLLGPSAALLLNAIKALGGIPDAELLLPRSVIEPVQELKCKYLGNHNPRLHTDEVLIALSVAAANNPHAALAIKQLSKLKGLEAHTTVILSAVDVNVFRRLGINVTHEPKYQTYKLFHK
ncbi:MAG: DUF1846 domain-containing protein [Clostridia bacterium]|nr:DUF1846 domain-containing protein [Clostridia bacterium]